MEDGSMPESETFEEIVKAHIDTGAEVCTAIGRAIEEDPEAYGQYLKRQKNSTIMGNRQEGSLKL
jgi:hypothetical protein